MLRVFDPSTPFVFVLCALSACATAGCTGAAFASDPGGDGVSASLSTGGIAVDPRTENAFVLQRGAPSAGATGVTAQGTGGPVYAIDPDTGAFSEIAELDGYQEIRMTFPESSVMVLGQDPVSGSDTILSFDPTSLALRKSVQTTAQFWGTRTSPSGKYVAVANNAVAPYPIDVIEAGTLVTHEMAPTGNELEAMWLRGSDTLVAIFFSQTADAVGSGRIVAWTAESLAGSGFAVAADGVWRSSTLDVTVPGVGFDLAFSFTWIGVSPDDRTIVIPVLTSSPTSKSGHELLVVDMTTGAIRTVDDALGPVGFTPDGSTIVPYRQATAAGDATLLLVDSKTLAVDVQDIPGASSPTYWVTSEGSDVVIAPDLGQSSLLVYDVATKSFEKVGGPPVPLTSFVERTGHDELWMVGDAGVAAADSGLFRLSFETATLTPVSIPWTPTNINILPTRDLLVLDDADSGDIRYFDPSTLSVARVVALPTSR